MLNYVWAFVIPEALDKRQHVHTSGTNNFMGDTFVYAIAYADMKKWVSDLDTFTDRLTLSPKNRDFRSRSGFLGGLYPPHF